MTSQPPFFVVGSERSGSTLFSLMLEHHPRLALVKGGEFDRAVALVGDDGTRPTSAELIAFAETDFEFYMTGERIDPDETHDENVRRWLEEARTRQEAEQVGGVVHKKYGRLPFVFPDARYIHLLRDGRDVTMSCIKKGWGHDVWHAADVWIEAETQWDVLCMRVDPDHTLEVRYEALVADTAGELDRVCGFLGIETRVDDMLSYPETTAYELPHPVMSEAWSTWPDEVVRLAEGRLGDALRDRGYELSGLEPRRPSQAELQLIRLRGRLSGMQARFGEYGLVTTTADTVGRRLRVQPLSDWATRRINETTGDNLTHTSAGVLEARSQQPGNASPENTSPENTGPETEVEA